MPQEQPSTAAAERGTVARSVAKPAAGQHAAVGAAAGQFSMPATNLICILYDESIHYNHSSLSIALTHSPASPQRK